MNKEYTFKIYLNEVLFLKDKVILPDNTRVSKEPYIKNGSFNQKLFEEDLERYYNEKVKSSNNQTYYK